MLSRGGLLFRVFCRAKDEQSLQDKIQKVPGKYSKGGKLIQDAIGVRVALYFSDDVRLVRDILSEQYETLEVVEDQHGSSTFRPSRLNMVFRLPEDHGSHLGGEYGTECVDDTFEVQLRTVLSEGWHEVEHDLRYKHLTDWEREPTLDRALNGILATLETCEWATLNLFGELAHRHYRSRSWSAMLRSALRLRFTSRQLSSPLEELLDGKPELGKQLLQFPRERLIRALATSRFSLPVTLDNACYAMGLLGVESSELQSGAPLILRRALMSGVGVDRPV